MPKENEIKVSKVVLTVKGKDIVLSLEDARTLKAALDDLFKVEHTHTVEHRYTGYGCGRWYGDYWLGNGGNTIGFLAASCDTLKLNADGNINSIKLNANLKSIDYNSFQDAFKSS